MRSQKFLRIFCTVTALTLVFSFVQPATSMAAAVPAYDGLVVSVSAPPSLAPGESNQVLVIMKNIGTTTWVNKGKNYVSLYHWNPVTKKEAPSAVSSASWSSTVQPSWLPTASVKPGQTVQFAFPVRAPSAGGRYHADFVLCAENIAWMKNSKFSLDLEVKGSSAVANTPGVSAPSSSPAAPSVAAPAVEVNTDWSAELVGGLGALYQIDAGSNSMVELSFKNTGKNTWTSKGANFVSLYATQGTKERESLFRDLSWRSKAQAGVLLENEVKPGGIGRVRFELRAPSAPGSYRETFTLAAENKAWISGSTFTMPISVPMYDSFVATARPETPELPQSTSESITVTPNKNTAYQTALLLRSVRQVSLLGNGSQEMMFGFKNTGSIIWNYRSMKLTDVKSVTPQVTVKTTAVRDSTWIDTVEPVRVQGPVNPGEVAFLSFRIKAPSRKGVYTASFQLHADNLPVEGGEIEIPITVTADGVIEPEPARPVTTTPKPTTTTPPASSVPSIDAVPLSGDFSSLPEEPILRVGIFKTTDDRMMIRAYTAPLKVVNAGVTVCRVNVGEVITLAFDRGSQVYSVSGGSCAGQSSSWYVVRAEDGISPMEIADFSRPVSWLPGANDNKFRAQLELRYTPATNSVWVINQLPIESYLKGIAETSNVSPQEYQRALLTGARTYAVYHYQRGTKHANEFYHVDATYDQVYRGYGAEARGSNIVAAIEATRGQIVTYNGKLAITPYYSRSDGRTRSWTEVWGGGPYPWLVSVPVPWDQGKTLWGHGVGLSASGALGMANDGKKYDEILKHFYQGIELRRAYR